MWPTRSVRPRRPSIGDGTARTRPLKSPAGGAAWTIGELTSGINYRLFITRAVTLRLAQIGPNSRFPTSSPHITNARTSPHPSPRRFCSLRGPVHLLNILFLGDNQHIAQVGPDETIRLLYMRSIITSNFQLLHPNIWPREDRCEFYEERRSIAGVSESVYYNPPDPSTCCRAQGITFSKRFDRHVPNAGRARLKALAPILVYGDRPEPMSHHLAVTACDHARWRAST